MGDNAEPKYLGGGWYMLPDGTKERGRSVALVKAEQQQVQVGNVDQLISMSDIAGRMRFLQKAGLQYKGVRDIYGSAGYVEEGAESVDNYWARYERDPVAGAIVDKPAKTTWKIPPEVFEGEMEKEQQTDFEKQWAELVKRLKMWKHFENVDRLARVGRYAVLLIGYRGGDDSDLTKLAEKMQGQGDVLYLKAYSERFAKIDEWEQDPNNERFGLPKVYKIDLSSGVTSFKAQTVRVHHSRVVHVAEDTLLDDVYGRPVLKRVLNALDDLLKVTSSTGEAYWQLAARILTGNVDPMAELPQGMMGKMGEALEEMVHDLRRQFIGQGVDVKWLQGEVPKPAEALEVYKQLMAVGSGIPTRILFGSEMGQLASSQDERSYFGMVNERQEHHAEPNILRPLIDTLQVSGALPAVVSQEEGYNVVWPPLFEMSEDEMASANLKRAQTAKELTALGNDPIDLVEVDSDRNVWLLSSEEIEKKREEREEKELLEVEEEIIEEPAVDLEEEEVIEEEE